MANILTCAIVFCTIMSVWFGYGSEFVYSFIDPDYHSLSLALLFFDEKFIGRSLATEEEVNYNDSRGTKHRLDFLREMRHICRRNR